MCFCGDNTRPVMSSNDNVLDGRQISSKLSTPQRINENLDGFGTKQLDFDECSLLGVPEPIRADVSGILVRLISSVNLHHEHTAVVTIVLPGVFWLQRSDIAASPRLRGLWTGIHTQYCSSCNVDEVRSVACIVNKLRQCSYSVLCHRFLLAKF